MYFVDPKWMGLLYNNMGVTNMYGVVEYPVGGRDERQNCSKMIKVTNNIYKVQLF